MEREEERAEMRAEIEREEMEKAEMEWERMEREKIERAEEMQWASCTNAFPLTFRQHMFFVRCCFCK